MKKILFSLLVVGLSLGFASCSSDDNENASIVGKWQVVEYKGPSEDDIWVPLSSFTSEYTASGTRIQNGDGHITTNSYKIEGDKILLYYIDDKENIKPNKIFVITKRTTDFLEYTHYSGLGDFIFGSYRFKRIK